MATKERLSYCLKHQERVTDKRCAACLKPICEECTQVTEIGNFCSDECYEKRVASNERVEMLRKEDEAERIPRLIRKIVSWVVLILMILGCYLAYPLLPSSVRKPVDKFFKTLHTPTPAPKKR